MRTGISITVLPVDRRRLLALVKDRNAPQKHVLRAEIVLLSAGGAARMQFMRQTGKSNTCVWRWQERSPQGLLRDKARPSRIKPLGDEVAARIVALSPHIAQSTRPHARRIWPASGWRPRCAA